MRKRYYIMFVARDADGKLLKIPIPLHYLYVFVAGALIGMMSITGMAGSYTRMLMKTLNYNELRDENKSLSKNYKSLEKAAKEKEIQVASMSTLASEVSALYGLKSEVVLETSAEDQLGEQRFNTSRDQLNVLKTSAMAGVTSMAIGGGLRNATMNDWIRLSASPSLWPVQGRITSSFGERQDPFNGEGAFHRGVDISGSYGQSIIAPADGVIVAADVRNGYGRTVIIDHGYGVETLYGHMSGYAVTPGQRIERGDVIGYIGTSGSSTGPHVHYEVHLNGTPVNPHRYLRTTFDNQVLAAHGD